MTDATVTPTPTPVPAEVHESIWQEFEDAWAKVKSVLGIVVPIANEAAQVVSALDPAIAPEVGAADLALNAANAAVQGGSITAVATQVETAIAAAKAVTAPPKAAP